jgi:hypothetical protein
MARQLLAAPQLLLLLQPLATEHLGGGHRIRLIREPSRTHHKCLPRVMQLLQQQGAAAAAAAASLAAAYLRASLAAADGDVTF